MLQLHFYGPGILPRFQKRIFEKMTSYPKKDLSNELARERSREAADRTLMAWIRTVLTLIGFGFAIASFREVLLETGLVRGPHEHFNIALIFGLSFIGLGVLGLLAATMQHWNILQHIKQDDFEYTGFRPLVFIMAILLMLIGLFAFIAVLVHWDY
jgi:putative membrane protein